jgi:hypothetical protein
MKNTRLLLSLSVACILTLAGTARIHAVTILADTVIEFYDSGNGPMAGPYGGLFSGAYPVSVPLSYATDGNPDSFVSLPKDSFLTLGFSSGFVFDGPGLDIFVSEVGGASEHANIYISSDFGATFTFLGIATTATVSGFDLASIGYAGHVNAVKVVGLDSLGGSPGFDLAYVEGLEGSVHIPTSLPTGAAVGALLALLGACRTRRALAD